MTGDNFSVCPWAPAALFHNKYTHSISCRQNCRMISVTWIMERIKFMNCILLAKCNFHQSKCNFLSLLQCRKSGAELSLHSSMQFYGNRSNSFLSFCVSFNQWIYIKGPGAVRANHGPEEALSWYFWYLCGYLQEARKCWVKWSRKQQDWKSSYTFCRTLAI